MKRSNFSKFIQFGKFAQSTPSFLFLYLFESYSALVTFFLNWTLTVQITANRMVDSYFIFRCGRNLISRKALRKSAMQWRFIACCICSTQTIQLNPVRKSDRKFSSCECVSKANWIIMNYITASPLCGGSLRASGCSFVIGSRNQIMKCNKLVSILFQV